MCRGSVAVAGLTEALTDLSEAEAGVAASLAAAAEAVNAAEGDDALEGDALETYVENFDEGDLEAAIEAAETDVAEAEADVNTKTGTLNNARAATFDSKPLLGAVSDANTDGGLDIDLDVGADSFMTDANIAKAVSEAQKAVNADGTNYAVVEKAPAAADAGTLADGELAPVVTIYVKDDGSLTTDVADAADEEVSAQAVEGKSGFYFDLTGDAFAGVSGGTFDADAAASISDSDLTSAKALQTAAINAESALNADVSANGTSQELLESLRDALGDLVKEGEDLSLVEAAGLDSSDVSGDGLDDLLSAINPLITAFENADTATKETAAETNAANFLASFSAEGEDVVTGDVATGNTALDKAVNDIIDSFGDRGELIDKLAAANTAFESTFSGAVLTAAEALQTERDGQIADVETAGEELTEAQDLVSSLETLQGDYDTAVEDLETAQQYFTDNDLEQPVAVEGGITATAENDIFLYTEEAGNVSGFGLEGDDQLFVGTDFTLTALEAADDLAEDRLGDSSVQEIFAQQNGNNVVLSFENEAFAGNATNLEDITEVTLTGVSVEDLSLSADGFITVA